MLVAAGSERKTKEREIWSARRSAETMRIRKNLNLTPSMIWSTAATPECPEPPPELMQPHICVLNRAPWDAPLSPPSSHQAMEEDDSYPNMNGTFFPDDSLPTAADSNDSMRISSENDNTGAIILHAGSGSGDGQIATRKESATPAPPPAARKTNADNDSNSNKNTAMGPPKRRGRPRKPYQSPLATSSNPYEFYYYSGFGPRWGKRRGGDQNSPAAEDNTAADRNNNSRKKKAFGNGGSSSSYYTQIEESDDELDFIDDDFDDEDDEDEYGGPRKRVRKPVKARSLKSLM